MKTAKSGIIFPLPVRRLAMGIIAISILFLGGLQVFASGGLDGYTLRLLTLRYFERNLVCVGTSYPTEDQSKKLCEIFASGKTNQLLAIEQLQAFVQQHPDSPWTPSLESNLGMYDYNNGYYSLALTNWSAAWKTTHALTDKQAKYVADYTLAHWLWLLGALGRKDELHTLFAETQGRVLDRGQLQRLYDSVREGYSSMRTDPGRSYRCGTLALNSVAKTLYGTNYTPHLIIDVPSPVTGFSMAALTELSATNHLKLVPVQRPASMADLVVPSVVHWKENHYAAIIGKSGDLYKVADPTFRRTAYLRADAINNEASGNFMVPEKQVPSGWISLTSDQTSKIFGKGDPAIWEDQNDNDCETCPCPPGHGGGNNSGNGSGSIGGSNGNKCSICAQNAPPPIWIGMPAWRISEPYVSLWLDDTPLAYTPAKGSPFALKITYSERDMRPRSPNVFDLGIGWNCNFLSYVDAGAVSSSSTDPTQYPVTLYLPLGGQRNDGSGQSLPDGQTLDPRSNSRLLAITNSVGQPTEYELFHPSGAEDVYGQTNMDDAGNLKFYLTQQISINGQAVTYVYDPPTNYVVVTNVVIVGLAEVTNVVTNLVVRLRYIVDADGHTNTISYTANDYSPDLVSQVADPFGHTVKFRYDDSGMLTNLVDVLGISTSFIYDEFGTLTNMTTPYGTTSFTFALGDVAGGNGDQYDHSSIQRAMLVTEPNGSHQLCLYRQGETPEDGSIIDGISFPDTYGLDQIPTDLPAGYSIITNNLGTANTFYWDRQQYANLSADPMAAGTFAMLTTNDYLLPRMRHWTSGTDGIEDTLLMERDPSPGGSITGKMTWYDYLGLDSESSLSVFPILIAKVLPDGTDWFQQNVVDEFGNNTNVITTYSYGSSILLRTNIYLYASNGQDLIDEIRPDGVTNAAYGYDANHMVLFMTNAVGEVTRYLYNANEQLISVTQPNGQIITNLYGSDNYLAQQIAVSISTNSYTWSNDLMFSHTDEHGLTVTNSWDALNRLTNMLYPDGTSMTYIYSNLDLIKMADRLGNATRYTYDSIREKTSQIDARNDTTYFGYCQCGALYSITDALQNVTYFIHDNQGEWLQTIYPDGYSITNTYDLIHQLVIQSDSSGFAVSNYYNNQGLLIASSNNVGRVRASVYDIDDRVTNSIDANNINVGMTYDNLDRLTTRSYPDTGAEGYGYTANISGPTSYTNQINHVWLYAYDGLNRKTNETCVGVTTNQFAYNGAGDLLSLTDGKNQTTKWGYDAFGQVTNKVDAANNTDFAYQYDNDNRLTNRWTPAKGATVYRYDSVGNLTNVVYPVSSNISLAYDADSRLTNMVDGIGRTAYGYDQVGQLLSAGGLWTADTVNYTNQNRLRTALSLSQPGSSPWVQEYGYDSARRLMAVGSPAGDFEYTYDAVKQQRVDVLELPNEAYITNSYDSMARLLSTALFNTGGTNLDSQNYVYDAAGQRTSETNAVGDYRNYTYNNEGELVAANGKEAGGISRLQEQFGYAYDAAGNLNFRTNNALIQAFNVNNLSELTTTTNHGTLTVAGTTTIPATSVIVNGLTASHYADATFALAGFMVTNGINTYTAIGEDSLSDWSTNTVIVNLPATNNYAYDLNGNLTNDGVRNFTYDDENQLISVCVSNAWSNGFAYDGKMRRRIERDYTWNAGWMMTNEVHFIYDGNVVVEERNIGNKPLVDYTRGNDLSGTLQGEGGISGLLAWTHSGQIVSGFTQTNAYYHADGNGNITCLIFKNQQVAAKYLYDPFGNTMAMSGPLANANKYRFSSKEWNENAGLYYYLYRFYDPNLQRWVNRDPIQEYGGWNLYEFTMNDPIDSDDSVGLTPPIPPPATPHNPTRPPSPEPPWKVPPSPLPMPLEPKVIIPQIPPWPILGPVTNVMDHCEFTISHRDRPPSRIWLGPIIGTPGGTHVGIGIGGTF